MECVNGQGLSQQTWTQVTSGKNVKSGFQKQAIVMGCSERQQGKKAKPAHKHSPWEIKAAALVKRLAKFPKT